MKKKIVNGLASLILPLGAYAGVSPAGGYHPNLRNYLRAGQANGIPLETARISLGGANEATPLVGERDELAVVPGQAVRELMIIDAAVPDKHIFYREAKPGVDIIEIDSSLPGLSQLVEVLGHYKNLSALHIVSHAEDGVLLLGNSRITAENIKHEIEAFAALNGAMREGGDLLLYGCDLASGEKGAELLDIVQKNTHLDLAASSNLTGSAAQSGDWELEIRRGETESTLPFSAKALADFSHLLAGTFTLNDNAVFTYRAGGETVGEVKLGATVTDNCPTDTDGTYYYHSVDSTDYIGCGFMHNNGFGGTTVGLVNYFDSAYTPAFLKADAYDTSQQATVSGTNHIEIRRRSGAFQLTDVVADEFSGSTTFSDVWITGYVEGGETITSEHITTDGSSVSTFTFDSANALSNFVGVNLTKFRLSFINQTESSVDYMRLVSFTTQPAVTNNAPTDISLDAASISQIATGAGAVIGNLGTTDADGGDTHTYSLVANGASDNGSCGAAGDDDNTSFQVDNVNDDLETAGSLSAGTYNICVETDDGTASYQESFTISVTVDADGTLTAGPAAEAIGLDTSIDTVGEAVDIFDFTMADGSGGDGVSMMVSQIVVNVSGTSTDAERGQVTWRLDGPDVSNVTGTYNAGSDTITFSGLSIAIADGDNETYTVNAFFNDNTNVVEDHTFILNINGEDDLTVGAGGTQMSGGNADITNGAGASIDIAATRLALTTQPAGSVSGSALTSQPVVAARDEFGNTDVDFTETITLSEASAGSLSGDVNVAAVAGVATFTDVAYTATADQQSFTLTANDQDGVGTDLPTVDANAITSDVVATKLVFSTQPAPTNVISGQATSLTTAPVVYAMDANDVVDTGYSTLITLAEVNGAGTATLTSTDDTDGDGATVVLNPASGVATFTGMQLTYTAAGSANETFNLRATSGGLTTADSSSFTATIPPLVTSVDVPVNGTYKIGDMLTFTVNTSENVTVSGTPRIAVTVGSDTVYAEYSSGASAPTALAFTYTVTAGDLDSNGIAIAGIIDANGGTLQDGDANDLVLTLNSVASTAAVLVDAIAPTISSVSVPANGTYTTGQTLSFTVNTTENVTVTGTPSLPLTIGATAREAEYVSGTGTSALVFSYTIQAGDNDANGIAIGASAVLNGGTLRDAAGNNLTLLLNSVGTTSGVLVDAAAPAVQSLSPADDSATVAPDANFVMTFSENITLGAGDITIYDSLNDPVITIDVASHGGQLSITDNDLTINPAADLSESTSYYIQLDNGAVTDLAGVAYAGIADSTSWNFTVADVTPPTVTSIVVAGPLSPSTDMVQFTVTFDEVPANISVSDFTLTPSGEGVSGNIASNSPVNLNTVTVTIDQISGVGTLRLDVNANSGITDTLGNGNGTNGFVPAFTTGALHTVDRIIPTISSVEVPAGGAYTVGDVLSFTVNTTEDITVAGGVPRIAVTVGGSTRYATYVSGSDSSALVFEYTVQDGDTDADGITVGSEVDANGATLRDAAGNDLSLSLNGVADATAVLVDTAAPGAPAAPDLDAGSDTGSSNSDNITNDTTPTLSGTAEANSTVTLVSSESGTLGTTTADGSGTWSFTPGSALVAGEHDLTATATDAAGNTSAASAALAVTIDTTAPATNGAGFDQADIDGTNQTAISFTFVSAEIGALANYTITSSAGGIDVTGSASVTDAEGQISGLNVSGLNDGDLTLSVTLTDVAGNVSGAMTDTIVKDVNPVLVLPLDPDAIIDGATTTITGVSVASTDSDSISVELSVAAGTIGVADSGATIVGNNTAEVSLTGTRVQVNDALAGLSFTAAVNTTDDQTLQIDVDDGVGSASGTLNIVIHDRPDIDNLDGTITFTIGGNAVALDPSPLAAVSDLDNLNFDGGILTISITDGAAPLQDLLSFNTEGEISLAGLTHGSNVLVDGTLVGTLVNDIGEGQDLSVALNADATPANVALLLQALTYDNTQASPTTGSRTVTITLDDGLAERVVTLSVRVQNPPPAGGGNVIDNNQSNNNLTGIVTITEDGVLNGGTVTGTINSSGTIAGDVTLGANTIVNGGTVTGNLTGNAGQPARINNAVITSNASLSNVIVGQDTVLQPGVTLGENVKFESEASIPPGLDLTGALRTLDWSTGDARPVAILDDDVLSSNAGEDPMTIIRAIQLLDDYEPVGNSVDQNSSNGEILVVTADFQAAVLPVQVTMADANDVEGTYINDDGDIVFVTVNRRVVLSYPVVASLPGFMALLEGAGLELTYNARANMQVRSRSDNVAGVLGREVLAVTSEGGDFYYSARPDVLALPAHRSNTPGLMEFPIPGLGSPNGLSVIFADEDGTLYEQDLIPASPDWPGLKAGLLAIEGLTHVSIDTQGIISVTLNGQTVRGRLEYVVFTGREAAREDVIIRAVGDKTGNGQQDYEVVYQNGDVQYLYVF